MRTSPEALRLGAVVAVLTVTILSGLFFGMPVALLVLAGCALLLGISLVWTSVQSLTGETALSLEEALTLGAPSAEEEQKRSVLRALKDLEYERSVGKISAEDYQQLSARYRAEAKRLMHLLDEGLRPQRERAEKLLQARLAKEGIAGPPEPSPTEAPEPAAKVETPLPEPKVETPLPEPQEPVLAPGPNEAVEAQPVEEKP